MNLLKNDLLEKLTIIILSKDREKELSQVIDFWSKTSCSVVIVHDSPNPLNLNTSNQKITYLNSSLPILLRLALASKQITTPYTIICNDDEILLIDSLKKFINIMQHNAQIDAIGGQAISYNWAGKHLLGNRIYPHLLNFSNMNEIPINRIRATFKINNMMDVYLLFKSDQFKKIVKCCEQFYEFKIPVMYETMWAVFSSYFCCIRRMNDIYWMRNWFTPFHHSESYDRDLSWEKWCRDPKSKSEVSEWIIKFKMVLSNETNLSEMQITSLVELLLQYNKKEACVELSQKPIIQTRLKTFLKKIIPKFLIRNIQTKLPFTRSKLMPNFDSVIYSQDIHAQISDQDIKLFKSFAMHQKKLYE